MTVIVENLLVACTKNYRHNLLINCPFCYRRYAYKETLMHHIHAVHADQDLSALEHHPEMQHPRIKPAVDHNQNDAANHATSLIPGSLRLRGTRRTLTPDWKTPVSGITTTSDHRRKFKINQVKTMKLVKDGKVVDFEYQSNSTNLNGKKVFFKNRKGDPQEDTEFFIGNSENLFKHESSDTDSPVIEEIKEDPNAELEPDVKIELLEEDDVETIECASPPDVKLEAIEPPPPVPQMPTLICQNPAKLLKLPFGTRLGGTNARVSISLPMKIKVGKKRPNPNA
jgi:hypothetical protein